MQFQSSNNTNPQHVSVHLNVSGEVYIKVLNKNGLIAKKFITDSGNINNNLSDLQTGEYVVNAFNNGGFIASFRFQKS